VRYIYLIQHML